METYSIYCVETGVFNGEQVGGDSEFVELNTPTGCAAFPGRHDHEKVRLDVLSGELVDYQPPSPGDDSAQTWAWDTGAKGWMSSPTLAAVRASAWASIKAERDRRLSAGFTVAGRHYQVNQAAMSGATLGAFMALVQGGATADYRQAWVLADNSAVSLTAPEMIEVGQACKALVDDLWETSQHLRGLIDAIDDETGTLHDVAAVVWPE